MMQEHFFDGYKANGYALATLKAAADAGADWLVLCDTNELLAWRVGRPSMWCASTSASLGAHVHNDGDLAVANSLAAVEHGATMVQGTVNGLGERCGNANLCSIIPTLTLKMGRELSIRDLSHLTSLSTFVSETANVAADPRLPYVGRSAFAHKGGVHVSAVMKDATTYEHIRPEVVGNERRVLVSELAGTASILAKMRGSNRPRQGIGQVGPGPPQGDGVRGIPVEGAEASFGLLVRRLQDLSAAVPPEGFRIFVDVAGSNVSSEGVSRQAPPARWSIPRPTGTGR